MNDASHWGTTEKWTRREDLKCAAAYPFSMANTVGVNKLSVVTKDSNGVTSAFPDVCKTPGPAGPVPIPYPNVAKSSDTDKATKKVTVQGNPVCVEGSCFSTSTGDEAGSAGGGVVSGTTQGKAEFINYSFDVQFEGKNVARAFDLMLHNDKNTLPVPLMQPPLVAKDGATSDLCCGLCGDKRSDG